MTTNKVTNTTHNKNEALDNELARVAAYAHMLGQLCELAPHAEPIPLEQLEIIFKDIAQVCDASLSAIHNLSK